MPIVKPKKSKEKVNEIVQAKVAPLLKSIEIQPIKPDVPSGSFPVKYYETGFFGLLFKVKTSNSHWSPVMYAK